MENKVHENIVLKFGVHSVNENNVIKIGKALLKLDVDNLTDGGFWIWDIKTNEEFYSPKFIKSLGFKDASDFPFIAQSWQNMIKPEYLDLVFHNFNQHVETGGEHPYYQIVEYFTKNKTVLKVLCSGTIFKNLDGSPKYMVGTHKIIAV